MDIKQRNKNLKKTLTKVFNKNQVSVRGGTGTATGWVDIDITLSEPINCQCDKMFGTGMDRQPGYCPICKDLLNKARERADNAIKDIEFYTHTDDCNAEHKEYVLQVSFNN